MIRRLLLGQEFFFFFLPADFLVLDFFGFDAAGVFSESESAKMRSQPETNFFEAPV